MNDTQKLEVLLRMQMQAPDIFAQAIRHRQLLEENRKESRDGLRMYVLVHKEILTPVQYGVQAAHAVAEFMDKHPDIQRVKQWVRRDKTMIFLGASLFEILSSVRRLKANKRAFAAFKEPDLGGEVTAVACEPMRKEETSQIFGIFGLPLLT